MTTDRKNMIVSEEYVIRAINPETRPGNRTTRCYWSNEFGWVDFINGTRFLPSEKGTFLLPMGGEWEPVKVYRPKS